MSDEKPDQNRDAPEATMTEREFHERLWADPEDASASFLAASEASGERSRARQEAIELNAAIRRTMEQVQPASGLLDRLLGIPEQAANDGGILRRLLPVAAVLLLAVGLAFYYHPDANAALAGDIFSHIYFEEPYYGDNAPMSVAEVNARMEPMFSESLDPQATNDELKVTFAKDCLIARQRVMHLVVRGEKGPVNLVMFPGKMVDHEVKISDKRFNGIVTPASGGTLVVVGNKQEPITEYRNALAHSLHWEY